MDVVRVTSFDLTSDGRRLVAIVVALVAESVKQEFERTLPTAGALGCAVAFAFYLRADRFWERDVRLPALLTSDL